MRSETRQLLEKALRLPLDDRAALAASLIESLDENTDNDAQQAWSAEIARRLAELDSGAVKPVAWPEARPLILGTPPLAPIIP